MRRGFGALVILGMVSGVGGKELPRVGVEAFASGFVAPIGMVPYRDGEESFLVVDQTGLVSFLGADGGKPTGVFLDVRDRMVKLKEAFDERGLLGLALHPEFAENGKVYVHYSAPLRDGGPEGFDHTAKVVEFTVPKGAAAADPESERLVLAVDEPQWNHDGGNPVFGPDGFLYLGFGDGGGSNDTGKGHVDEGNGQALDQLLGKILRIDVDGGDPYGIPEDNPLVGKEGRDEIYAWGIRNPWGMTFDPGGSGELIVADVGQARFEEINVVEKGGNHGWPRAEGRAAFESKKAAEVVDVNETTAPSQQVLPVMVYPHHEGYGECAAYGISVTGGHVYRGEAIPELRGVYVFGDWSTSWSNRNLGLFAGVREAGGAWTIELLPGSLPEDGKPAMVTGFARDRDGELFVLSNGSRSPTKTDGMIWKLVPGK